MSKKSQVTIFILLGVVLIGALIFLYYTKSVVEADKVRGGHSSEGNLQGDIDKIDSYLQSCAKSSLHDVINSYGLNKSKILSHLKDNVTSCLGNLNFGGLNITHGELTSEFSIGRENVVANVDFPVNISKGDSFATINKIAPAYDLSKEVSLPLDSHCVIQKEKIISSRNKDANLTIPEGTKIFLPDGGCVNNIKITMVNSSKSATSLFDYTLQPNSATFSNKVTLKMGYKDDNNDGVVDKEGINERHLVIRNFQEAGWNQLPTTLNSSENFLTTRIKHLARFGTAKAEPFSARVYPEDPATTPKTKIVKLHNLDGSGYLRGDYINVVNFCKGPCEGGKPGKRVYSPQNIFVFEPVKYGTTGYFGDTFKTDQGHQFDETMSYYAGNMAAKYFKKLGFNSPDVVNIVLYHPPIGNPRVQKGAGWYNHEESAIKIPPQKEGSGFNYMRDVKGIIHEYTHHAYMSVVGGYENNAANEGYAVYFPHTIVNDSRKAYISPEQRDIENDNWNEIDDKKGRHIYSIASSLWDIRKKLGRNKTDNLIFHSWKLQPINQHTGGVQTLVSLVEADKELYDGNHTEIIKDEFNRHGIVCETCSDTES